MAVVLEWARTYTPTRDDIAIPFHYEILMTLAHIGAREDEVLGLEREDVDLVNRVIHIRPNNWRRLKSENSERDLPIPSDLFGVLVAYETGSHLDPRRCMHALPAAGIQ
jgi:integrase